MGRIKDIEQYETEDNIELIELSFQTPGFKSDIIMTSPPERVIASFNEERYYIYLIPKPNAAPNSTNVTGEMPNEASDATG